MIVVTSYLHFNTKVIATKVKRIALGAGYILFCFYNLQSPHLTTSYANVSVAFFMIFKQRCSS